jgi:hypothetical protein
MPKIYAPEQVAALERWQASGRVHPFTCPTRHLDNEAVVLRPEEDGWHCPGCDYRQDWAHDFMTSDLPPWPFTGVFLDQS